MKMLTGFLLGAVCGALGFASYGWLGWFVGMLSAISIITIEHVLEVKQ